VREISDSCIDHIYVNLINKYAAVTHFPAFCSDHHLVSITRKEYKMKKECQTIHYRAYSKGNLSKLNSLILTYDFSYLSSNNTTVNAARFTNHVLNILDTEIPLKSRKVKHVNSPWFSSKIARLCTIRNKLKQIASSEKSKYTWLKYKNARNNVGYEIRAAKKMYFNTKFAKVCESQSLRATVNELTNFRTKSTFHACSLVDPSTNMVTYDTNQISQIFANSFTVNSVTRPSDFAVISRINEYCKLPHSASDEFTTVTEDDITDGISHLKNKGGPGRSFIPIKALKILQRNISKHIATQFSTIFTLCSVPLSFKTSIVFPLYKGKGPHTDANSFRPIVLLSPMVKLFDRVLFTKLLPLVEDRFIDEQHGYRRHRSCNTALTVPSQGIFNFFDSRSMRVGAVFVDLRKAFNSVDHNLLLNKLICQFQLNSHIIRFFRNYVNNRLFNISGDSSYTQATLYNECRGVPQGSPMGIYCSRYLSTTSRMQ